MEALSPLKTHGRSGEMKTHMYGGIGRDSGQLSYKMKGFTRFPPLALTPRAPPMLLWIAPKTKEIAEEDQYSPSAYLPQHGRQMVSH